MRGMLIIGSFVFAVSCTGVGSDSGSDTEQDSASSSPGSSGATGGSATSTVSSSSATASGTGSSATQTTSAGTSGTGGADPVVTCTAGAVPEGSDTDPEEKKQVMADDGTSVDHCDDNGNLVEVQCETVTECGPGPNPDCTTTQTGNTTTEEFDCNGTCVDGSCEARCPDFGDELEYVQVGEPVTLQNNEDGRSYSCALVFDQANDTYDCTTDPTVGEKTTVMALGLSDSFCTGGHIGNIQTSDGCSYTCTLL